MGSVFGNAKAYFSMKAKINLQENDQLYVLGNIFDGNDEHPEQCLIILEDIMKNNNITLIVGDHEFWHYILFRGDKVPAKFQTQANIEIRGMCPTMEPLCDFLSTLSQEDKEHYFNYILSCQPHKIIRIKDQLYFLSSAYPLKVDFWGCTKNKTIKEDEYLLRMFEFPSYYYNKDYFPNFVADLKKGRLSFEDKHLKYYEGLENAIVITSFSSSYSVIKKVNEEKGPGYRKYNYSTLNTIPYGDYQRVITDDKNNISIYCGCCENQYDVQNCVLKPTLACLRIDDDNNITVIYKHNLYE